MDDVESFLKSHARFPEGIYADPGKTGGSHLKPLLDEEWFWDEATRPELSEVSFDQTSNVKLEKKKKSLARALPFSRFAFRLTFVPKTEIFFALRYSLRSPNYERV